MDVHVLGARARDLLADLARRLLPARGIDDLSPDSAGSIETRVRFAGRTLRLWVRHRTDDAHHARALLRSGSELELPDAVRPKVVLDLSAGVGLASIYYAMVYPDADIYAFEADPAQLDLLRTNAQRHSTRVQVFSVDWDDPEHVGAFRLGIQTAATRIVESVLSERSLEQVDVVHVDADAIGAAMMRSLPGSIRRGVKAYVGQWRGTGRSVLREMLSISHVLEAPTTGPGRYIALRNDLVPSQMIAGLVA